jgi:hypothetical protein
VRDRPARPPWHAQFLDKPLLMALVLSRDRDARKLATGLLALPVAWALGVDEAPVLPRVLPAETAEP